MLGADEAYVLVTPAHQGLHAGDFPRQEVLLRLIVDFELIALHGAVEVVFQYQALDGGRIHGFRVELVVIPAPLLGVIHRRVGILDKGFEIRSVHGKERDADAHRGEDLAAAQVERLRHDLQDSPRHLDDRLHVLDLRENDREFVPSHAGDGDRHVTLIAVALRHGIGHPKGVPQTPADGHKKLIADSVPQCIVDVLEPVKVEEHHRHHVAVPPGQGDGQLQAILEQQPVGKSGQAVVIGEVGDSLLGVLSL